MKTRKKLAESPAAGLKRIDMSLLPLYRACLRNAEALLTEAELLLEHDHVPRAFALGYTAYEEIGKAQVVADHFSGIVAESEFQAAFKDHHLKSAYVRRFVQVHRDRSETPTIEYDPAEMKPYVKARMDSLYVDFVDGKPQTPEGAISRELAESVVRAGRSELEFIRAAEMVSERIGSKGLFK